MVRRNCHTWILCSTHVKLNSIVKRIEVTKRIIEIDHLRVDLVGSTYLGLKEIAGLGHN